MTKISIYKIDEVVFCSKSIPQQLIIDKMTELQYTHVDFRIAPPESLSIIGSNSIITFGDIYMLNINSISRPDNRRSKFLLDLVLSLFFLGILPIGILIVKRPHYFVRNIFQVLFGVKSWVGYYPGNSGGAQLPGIRKGVLSPADSVHLSSSSPEIYDHLNILYANDYRITTDLGIIWKGFRRLGRK